MHIQGGHQQDAEEFLGLHLHTPEETLTLANSLSPPAKDAEETKEVEEDDEGVEDDDVEDYGWLEVGQRNRMATTRTVSLVESSYGARARN